MKQATRRNVKIQFHQMEHSIKGFPLSTILTREVLFLVQVITVITSLLFITKSFIWLLQIIILLQVGTG